MAERLIDAETFLDFLRIEEKIMEDEEITFNYMRSLILTAPTIEAKPIVHAHWIEKHSLYHICSECHHDAPYKMNGYDAGEDFAPYCPFCGAQMDEVVE